MSRKKVVHFDKMGGAPLCGAPIGACTTTRPYRVTCGRCLKSRDFRFFAYGWEAAVEQILRVSAGPIIEELRKIAEVTGKVGT